MGHRSGEGTSVVNSKEVFPKIIKAPAVVLGSLNPNYIRVIVLPRVGMVDGGVQHDLPLEIVPPDLRMPNTEFMVLLDRTTKQFVGVERRASTQKVQD
jgi:hypothetical protein